eukprot:1881365-Amphidinium_carterae.1
MGRGPTAFYVGPGREGKTTIITIIDNDLFEVLETTEVEATMDHGLYSLASGGDDRLRSLSTFEA